LISTAFLPGKKFETLDGGLRAAVRVAKNEIECSQWREAGAGSTFLTGPCSRGGSVEGNFLNEPKIFQTLRINNPAESVLFLRNFCT
jgi:hypothetical protein